MARLDAPAARVAPLSPRGISQDAPSATSGCGTETSAYDARQDPWCEAPRPAVAGPCETERPGHHRAVPSAVGGSEASRGEARAATRARARRLQGRRFKLGISQGEDGLERDRGSCYDALPNRTPTQARAIPREYEGEAGSLRTLARAFGSGFAGCAGRRGSDVMKVVVNELNSCKRGLEVEVPGERVSEEMERTFREYSRRARIPGFRQGKIPIEVVRRRFGKEVQDEVVEKMVREYALRALEEKKLHPVHDPVLEGVNYQSGKPLTFKATFEVRPAVSVSGYHKIPVTVGRREVTEEMIEASLRGLAERAAKLEAVSGRPVQKGDYVVGTLSCRYLKGRGKNLVNEPLLLEAGSENNHPDFNAAVLGLEAGRSASFETTYPEDWSAEALRGCTVAYTIEVKEIKTKVLPPVNDDLAKEVGNFQSLDELREKVTGELRRRAKEAETSDAKDRILAHLVEQHSFDVPEALVESQIGRASCRER